MEGIKNSTEGNDRGTGIEFPALKGKKRRHRVPQQGQLVDARSAVVTPKHWLGGARKLT